MLSLKCLYLSKDLITVPVSEPFYVEYKAKTACGV